MSCNSHKDIDNIQAARIDYDMIATHDTVKVFLSEIFVTREV